jgi:hypothetical protein
MSIFSRIKRLEAIAAKKGKQEGQGVGLTEEEWLDHFAELGRQGFFAGEADFPVALSFYRNALAKAAAQTDPPWNPPDDFLPNSDHFLRLVNWRNSQRFPDVRSGWMWLAEMAERVSKGIPHVTEAEFNDFARWFHDHDTQLYRLSLPSQIFNLGDGRTTTAADIRYKLTKGCRAIRAGELAEDLRRLRSLYRERLDDGTSAQES